MVHCTWYQVHGVCSDRVLARSCTASGKAGIACNRQHTTTCGQAQDEQAICNRRFLIQQQQQPAATLGLLLTEPNTTLMLAWLFFVCCCRHRREQHLPHHPLQPERLLQRIWHISGHTAHCRHLCALLCKRGLPGVSRVAKRGCGSAGVCGL